MATGHYVGVLAPRDAALRDSVNAILRARMRDGSLEKMFRAWNVWDDGAGAVFRARARGSARRRPARHRAACASVGARISPRCFARRAVTLLLSCLAMALAVAVGMAVAAGRVYGPPLVRAPLAVYVELMRGTPVLLQLFVLYYGLSGVVRLPAFSPRCSASASTTPRTSRRSIVPRCRRSRARSSRPRARSASPSRRSSASCAGRRRSGSRSRR